MHLETHLACGWLIANLLPRSSRRERLLITATAVASDSDGLSWLAGTAAYARWHHTFGHTLLTMLAIGLAAVIAAPAGRRAVAGAFALVACSTHLAGDYFLSSWPLPLLSPLSSVGYRHVPPVPLDHPVNIGLSYAGLTFCAASLWWWKRTPLELLWPRLDHLLARMARARHHVCRHCGRRTAVTCDVCGKAICFRHAIVSRRLQVRCRACSRARELATEPLRPRFTDRS
jgi:membrane-bound metal-dependent hydrolase YbcI (DUF457 family)